MGLDPAVDRLHESLREARRAHVQSVLISGGFGMGKTALMCEFANQISSSARAPRILRAQGDRWSRSCNWRRTASS